MIVENLLYRKLLSNNLPDKNHLRKISVLLDNKNNLSVNEICKEQNISRKHLNELSKKYIGVSPKSLSSLNRLQRILKSIGTSSYENLTDVAYQAYYFDQAHFINDFKKLTNLKPSEYAKLVEEHQSMKMVPHFIPYG